MNIVESLRKIEQDIFKDKHESHDLVGAYLNEDVKNRYAIEALLEKNDTDGLIKLLECDGNNNQLNEDYYTVKFSYYTDDDQIDEVAKTFDNAQEAKEFSDDVQSTLKDSLIKLDWDFADENSTRDWELLDRKTIKDFDGFNTEYTLWKKNNEDYWVCVFGDSDLYGPEDGEFDAEFETEKEAREWFDNYSGFEDEDIDESLKESRGKHFAPAFSNPEKYIKKCLKGEVESPWFKKLSDDRVSLDGTFYRVKKVGDDFEVVAESLKEDLDRSLLEKIKEEIEEAFYEKCVRDWGFPSKEEAESLLDPQFVITKNGNISVFADFFDYEEQRSMAEELDSVIQQYEKDVYFDDVARGHIKADLHEEPDEWEIEYQSYGTPLKNYRFRGTHGQAVNDMWKNRPAESSSYSITRVKESLKESKKGTVEQLWDGDTYSYQLYVDGKSVGSFWEFDEVKEFAKDHNITLDESLKEYIDSTVLSDETLPLIEEGDHLVNGNEDWQILEIEVRGSRQQPKAERTGLTVMNKNGMKMYKTAKSFYGYKIVENVKESVEKKKQRFYFETSSRDRIGNRSYHYRYTDGCSSKAEVKRKYGGGFYGTITKIWTEDQANDYVKEQAREI